MGEVPLAPFLSGGIDSYAVVESMTRALGRPVTACTIGFADPQFDERAAARAAAAACGASLHEEVLAADEMLALDWFTETFDEPFSDSSAIPTYHVCRLARRHVTVALSGDGGDEGFAGYRRYLFDLREHQLRRWLPVSQGRLAAALAARQTHVAKPWLWAGGRLCAVGQRPSAGRGAVGAAARTPRRRRGSACAVVARLCR
jgi:asparagine synthase (glutamine-hydrolysing)